MNYFSAGDVDFSPEMLLTGHIFSPAAYPLPQHKAVSVAFKDGVCWKPSEEKSMYNGRQSTLFYR